MERSFMMRVTLEIIPKGDENKKFVAGVLEIVNDGTGTPLEGNYDLKITGPVDDGGIAYMDQFWKRDRLLLFPRAKGWWACVREALKELNVDYDIPHKD